MVMKIPFARKLINFPSNLSNLSGLSLVEIPKPPLKP